MVIVVCKGWWSFGFWVIGMVVVKEMEMENGNGNREDEEDKEEEYTAE